MVRDEILEQTRTFCPSITIIVDHLNPLSEPFGKEQDADD